MDSPDCILNPNLQSCKSPGPAVFGLVNENHLEPTLVRQADEERREPSEMKDPLRSPETEPSDGRPALTFPVRDGVICTPGSGRRCQAEASDCSRVALDPSCLVWPESEGCAEVLDCHYLDRERNPPVNVSGTSCEGGLAGGECGADEGNKGKITESDKKCNTDTCWPGPGTLSHGGTECLPGNPLCWPLHKEEESFIKKGQADCLDGSDDTDCISQKSNCSHGSPDPRCRQEPESVRENLPRENCTDENDEDCQSRIEKGTKIPINPGRGRDQSGVCSGDPSDPLCGLTPVTGDQDHLSSRCKPGSKDPDCTRPLDINTHNQAPVSDSSPSPDTEKTDGVKRQPPTRGQTKPRRPFTAFSNVNIPLSTPSRVTRIKVTTERNRFVNGEQSGGRRTNKKRGRKAKQFADENVEIEPTPEPEPSGHHGDPRHHAFHSCQ